MVGVVMKLVRSDSNESLDFLNEMSNINGGNIDGVPSKLLVYSESDENDQVKPHFSCSSCGYKL